MFKKLKQDLFCLSDIKIPLIVFTASFVLLGILTWATAGGVHVFWRLVKKPPFTPPLSLLFALWIVTYALFGVFTAVCLGAGRSPRGAVINAAAGFFLALFWRPLFFGGRIVVSLCALAVSSVVIIPSVVRCGRFSRAVFAAAVPIWILEAFFIFLNCGFIAS